MHGIPQSCGGFIKVKSEQGQGTEFEVYFPVLEESVAETGEERAQPLPRGDERIMLVDDDESIAAMFKEVLENLGYLVHANLSSKKTLEEFQASPDNFDLIITDQTMPELSGSELAEKILQIRPDMRIILVTGHSSMISGEKAEEIGVKRFLMKPISVKELALNIREVLDG